MREKLHIVHGPLPGNLTDDDDALLPRPGNVVKLVFLGAQSSVKALYLFPVDLKEAVKNTEA